MSTITDNSETMKLFRSPPVQPDRADGKDIGLWGPKVQKAFAAMGAIGFAEADAAAMLDNDWRVANEFDAKNTAAGRRRLAARPLGSAAPQPSASGRR